MTDRCDYCRMKIEGNAEPSPLCEAHRSEAELAGILGYKVQDFRNDDSGGGES